jgi:hypothetical protein
MLTRRWPLRLAPLALLLLLLTLVARQLAAQGESPEALTRRGFLPVVRRPAGSGGGGACQIPNTSYASLPMIPPPTNPPAAQHPDINLAIRGYASVNAPLQLVNYAGGVDPNAPQLDALFQPRRLPVFSAAYQVYKWDWGCNCRGPLNDRWPTTLLGMRVAANEIIRLPDSGYDIGGGYEAHVLYAAPGRITLKYTGEDSAAFGYTVHVEGICVEPDLLALYQQDNAAGRGELPALRGGQPFGRAIGMEIKVAIRDAGSFLDPRSRKDWWQSH